jgi:hypothetical protein
MRIFVAAALGLIAALCSLDAFGQVDVCPTIKIHGPADFVSAERPFVFRAEFEGGVPPRIEYNWSVKNGQIDSGEFTNQIEVSSAFQREPYVVDVRLVVVGLKAGCKNSFTAFAAVVPNIPACGLQDEYSSDLSKPDQMGRLDTFFAELRNGSISDKGFLLIRIDEKESRKSAIDLIRFVIDHARFRKFDVEQLMFGIETADRSTTTLFRVPPGAELPCDKCEIRYPRDLK